MAKAGNLPEAVHARGVMAARQGREDEARRLFGQADKAGVKAATEKPEADGYGVTFEDVILLYIYLLTNLFFMKKKYLFSLAMAGLLLGSM